MHEAVTAYIGSIQREFATGHAQEHSYRPALKALFEATTKLEVVNEPKGSAHGRPDFIFFKNKKLPIAWVEAKDLHVSLDKVEKSEQMARYFGYANLILTNGLEFRFFKNGKRYGEGAVLAVKHGDAIEPQPSAYGPFGRLVADFIEAPADTIRSAQHLAQIMGGKAARLRDNITEMLRPDYAATKGIEIEKIRDVLKTKLIHDLTDEAFADLYAQTLVYGLFVARYHDETPETFTRAEARERIPASNHLLRQFFDHIAGANFETRLLFIVDELCDVFLHSDVHALVHGIYQKEGDTHDPIIHFYEDFLREYDPKLRASRGVFYTPLPVARYIVRSVDHLLQEHFGLKDGLADRATMEWQRTVQGKKTKQTIDRVQILDPATGTGTFLNEVILHIHERFKGQEGGWPKFVSDHLMGRLNGFELMMASYTIAHLKLSMTLAETGVKETRKRLRVFLTNSLEVAPTDDDTLFAPLGLQGALTEEAHAAAEVKRDLPIMVVLGNPPYSVSSQNPSAEVGKDGKKRKTWIGTLLDDYKKDLNEKKLNLDDDYIKFIRFAHHLIEKNGQGIVAMITNNSFLDGITHRRMRECLLTTFDHIYVVDLHGDSKRKEQAPDGGKDENVFDIQQGVAISIFVRTEKAGKKPGTVRHVDVYGDRESKYAWLEERDDASTSWTTLEAAAPNFFFVPKDLGLQTEYEKAIHLAELFPLWNSGIKTDRDSLFIDFSSGQLARRIEKLLTGGYDSQFASEYRVEDSGSYKLTKVINGVSFDAQHVRPLLYRPFDTRATYYDLQIVSRPAAAVMSHLLRSNLALLICRQQSTDQGFSHVFVGNKLVECCAVSNRTREITSAMPLYIYPDSATVSGEQRTANLDMQLLAPALKKLKLDWVPDGTGDGKATCGPEDIFDYIYAVLHCPAYRSRYKEFLKIDFPRVPFTSSAKLFWKLVRRGREIRALHLLESPALGTLRTTYPIAGSDRVEKVTFDGGDTGKVWINAMQYFGDVPKVAWEFFIGGYQPAQKWLKDRKGRELSSDDIAHYQKIIIALCETDRLMKEIDTAITESGGWPMG